MGQVIAFSPRKGVINLDKRAAMKVMILAGTGMDAIARELGYANGTSAYVMAHRWGLHTLREESNFNKISQR